MLSRFDLAVDVSIDSFGANYHRFVADMKSKGLVECTGDVGRRLSDTPMDTDDGDLTEFYAVMSFRDRDQLDRAYSYIASTLASPDTAHPLIHATIRNSVFTCWEDIA